MKILRFSSRIRLFVPIYFRNLKKEMTSKNGVLFTENAISEQEIIEAINEWPVTPIDDNYYATDIDKISHPQSVSQFFLRNVGRKTSPTKQSSTNRQETSASSNTDKELLVDVALAKWWRKEGRQSVDSSAVPTSSNPDTIINFVANSDPGREFVKKGIRRLRDKIAGGSRGSDVHSALASFYEKAGSLSPAKMHLEAAIEKEPNDKELKWRMKRLLKMIHYRQEQENDLKRINFTSDSLLTIPEAKQVQRVSANSLSFQAFLENYAMKGDPVILKDLVCNMTTVPWTMEHIKQVAGDCTVKLKQLVKQSVQWAQLEDSDTMKVKDFINIVRENTTDNNMYLFDWSIPGHCPELAKELVIPKYFAGDFLQRTSEGSLYKDSWPSLFIASHGLTSELHVDTFGSNFWIALFEGRKRWVFYKKEDIHKLYPTFNSPWSSDPSFHVRLADSDLMEFPLLSEAVPTECILEAGEVLFVPAGCPHRVENLETSLAISGNFVDLSNFELVKQELESSGLLDERSKELWEQMSGEIFPSNMDANIEHLPWDKFKSWTKDGYDKFTISANSLCESKDADGQIT